ncbi:DNA polymerase III subunit epsilon [Corynebacterium bovis]|nr:DNA polymerase III subunit epsilon [Corynebacterium bovis]
MLRMTSSGSDSPSTPAADGESGSGHHASGGSRPQPQRRRRGRRRVVRRAGSGTRTTTPATGSANGSTGGPADGTAPATASGPPAGRRVHQPKTFQGDLPTVEQAPYVALTVATSGIHPTTSRMVAFAATLHAADGSPVTFTGNRGPVHRDTVVETPADAGAGPDGTSTGPAADGTHRVTGFVQQLNPGDDPGPWHLHGYTEADLAQAPGFATVAQTLSRLLDGRTLVCHDATMTWGFIVQEFRRAHRGSGRGRSGRGRQGRRVEIPTPTAIVDTLGTARHQVVQEDDARLRAVAAHYHLPDLPADSLPAVTATASLARAEISGDELLLADTRLLMPLHLAQRALAGETDAGTGSGTGSGPGGDTAPGTAPAAGPVRSLDPADLTADQFGLQRSTVRVDAATAPRPYENPGAWTAGSPLVQGMEIVVSPDIAGDADEIIGRAMRAGLAYSEKLNRTTSVVVCNSSHDLRGKAMHADRKGIPLVTDREFLDLLDDVRPGERTRSTTTPRTHIPAPQPSRAAHRRTGAGGSGSDGSRRSTGRGGARGQGRRPGRGGQSGGGKAGGQGGAAGGKSGGGRSGGKSGDGRAR